MTALDIGRISEEAQRVNFTRGLLTLIAAVLYAAGWITRKVFVARWLVAAWSWTAVRLGWQEAAPNPGSKPRPKL